MNKLLILEDDETLAQLFKAGFIRKGFVAYTAYNIEQASSLLEQYNFTHALLDLNIAGNSSLNFIETLKDKDDNIKIVMLTGYASINVAVSAIKNGALNFLTKPASVKEVLNAFLDGKQNEIESFTKTNLKKLEWENIQKILEKNNFNISKTATQLNMHRRTLQRKLQKNYHTK